jgi:hypothetical protein
MRVPTCTAVRACPAAGGCRRATRMRGLRAPVPRGRRLPPASCTSPLGLAPRTPYFMLTQPDRPARMPQGNPHGGAGRRTRHREGRACDAGCSPRGGEQEHRHVIRPSMITGRGMGRCGQCRDRRACRRGKGTGSGLLRGGRGAAPRVDRRIGQGVSRTVVPRGTARGAHRRAGAAVHWTNDGGLEVCCNCWFR